MFIIKSSAPGAVIAIEQHHKTIFKKGYGVSDLRTGKPITAGDLFNIGSLTKQFTAFALLDLYYQGKFSLTDSLGKFFKLPSGPRFGPDQPAAQSFLRNTGPLRLHGHIPG